ncbi:hypothetical protein HPB49_017285 [Dermacentor silvarum]|uniref:Uncharacterized protein n=1 Tax=Dermacentor silvarum TaxID=543639 RepID=A0ACB8CYU6_DERSI|nr:hypothetical protein HPB49_017285 [Dermacentor silvarum]
MEEPEDETEATIATEPPEDLRAAAIDEIRSLVTKPPPRTFQAHRLWEIAKRFIGGEDILVLLNAYLREVFSDDNRPPPRKLHRSGTVGFPRSVPVLSWLFSAGRSKNLRREAHGKCTAVAFHRKVPTLVRARPHRFLRRRASPSPGAVPFLLLDPSPTGSALRANPFPKVTDPFCRLPLPTLVYRLEAVHLGDLLRMWVRSGTKITLPHSDFQGPTGAHRTAQEPHCSTEPPSLSRGEPIPGTRSPYREKKTLPGAPIGVSELVCVAALGPEGPISVAGFGTVNPIPFWLQRGVSDSQTELHKRARF